MRSLWSCPSCAAGLILAFLGREASASHAGRELRNVHRVPKAQVTAHPVRRDEGTCQTEYTACPASLSGGCCPSQYACATDSCFATTAGPTTACGRSGYFACAPVNGEAGCCPVGYVCGNGGACIPPAGASLTNLQCPSNYFLCPSTLGYGCCLNGMGCAPNACYSTAPVTTTVVQTVTTTSGERTVTTTRTAVTVATPTPPSGLPTDDTNVAAKFIPTSVPKVAASSPTSQPSGGLSGGAIGGIIAGVVILLVAVVVAAFLIIRRLKRVEGIMESKQGSSSGKKTKSQSQAQKEHYGRQLHSDMDEMSVDPLMVSPHTGNNSSVGTPQPNNAHVYASRGRSDSAGFTPFTDDRSRHASPDSNAGYFDHPHHQQQQQQQQQQQPMQPMQPARMRSNTADSATTTTTTASAAGRHRGYAYHHWRQQSNASELSADGSDHGGGGGFGVNSPLVGSPIPELEAPGAYAELPSHSGYIPHAGTRARSDSNNHSRQRSSGGGGGNGQGQQSGPPSGQTSPTVGASGPLLTELGGAVQGQTATAAWTGGLATLDEAAESLHGFYGRRDQQAGQTAAGLGGDGGHVPGHGQGHGQFQEYEPEVDGRQEQ